MRHRWLWLAVIVVACAVLAMEPQQQQEPRTLGQCCFDLATLENAVIDAQNAWHGGRYAESRKILSDGMRAVGRHCEWTNHGEVPKLVCEPRGVK